MRFLFFLLDLFSGRLAERNAPIRCDGDPEPDPGDNNKTPIGG